MLSTDGGAGNPILFGGTFDPPHRGHLHVAHAARSAGYAPILFAVTRRNPLKDAGPRAPLSDREAMVACMIAGQPDWQIAFPGTGAPERTIDAVEALGPSLPRAASLAILVGADILDQLPDWHRVEELLSRVDVVVVPRPGAPETIGRLAPAYRSRIRLLDVPGPDVASRDLRDEEGAAADDRRLHPCVARYIADHELYR